MKKIPKNLLKNLKNGNIMEFCWSEKVGTLIRYGASYAGIS